MESYKVALLGLGTVGQGVHHTIIAHQEVLQQLLCRRVEVVAILIQNRLKERDIPAHIPITDSFADIAAIRDLDFVIEATVGAEPARTYILESLAKGCHVITANKECIATYGSELFTAANKHGRTLAIEATVAGGVPILRTLGQLLQVNRIAKIAAILNGTTNYILTRMQKDHLTFKAALAEAQHAGYAEADPKNDVSGMDAHYKINILAQLLFGDSSALTAASVKGIEEVGLEDLQLAEALGLRLKLLARLEGNGHEHYTSVAPTLVSHTHPLFAVEGVNNGIQIDTDLVGQLFLQGAGAGALPTASAIIEDLVHIAQGGRTLTRIPSQSSTTDEPVTSASRMWLAQVMHATTESIHDKVHRYYLPTGTPVKIVHSATIAVGSVYITGLVIDSTEADLQELSRVYPSLYRWYPILDWSTPQTSATLQTRDLVS